MELINFSVDQELCVGCEACVADCPLLILTMDERVHRQWSQTGHPCVFTVCIV